MNNNVWQEVSLGDYVSTLKGFAFKSQWYVPNGTPIIKVSDFTKDSVDNSRLTFIPENMLKKFSDYKMRSHDVVIQTVGSWPSNPESVVGKAIRIPKKLDGALLNQNAVRVTPKPQLDNLFLFYLLKDYRYCEYIVGCAQGAASQASITLDSIRSYKFLLPPALVQRKIGNILFEIDGLIDINNRKIEILEQMAQLLYREWFVEFRFPTSAKASAGKPGYEKHKFVDSELDKIPEGWKITTLREHLKLDKGVSYSGNGLTEEGNPMVNLKSISVDGRYVRGSDKPYSGDYKPRHILKPGDIVLANTDMTQNGNVVGKAAIVPVLDTDKEIICSHHIYAVRIKKNTYLKRNYLLNLLNSYYFHGHAKGYAVGTTVLGLSADSIYRFGLAQPEKEITDLFEEKTQKIYQLIENLENQNIVLQHTRDLLLPKLMSGEIDVSKLDINITEN